MALAEFEMKLVLATVLSCAQIELLQSKPVQPVSKGVVLALAEGVRMVVGMRSQNQRVLETSSSSVLN